MTNLNDLDAHDLTAAFRAGTATPVDALEAATTRMEQLEPVLNAMTNRNPAARAEAEASARRWRDGAPLGPLDGIPITIKDNLAAAGMPATFGSPAYREYRPTEDELPVARVRRAGAVVLGKTNLPEFALEGYTDNALFGPTGNPFNPALTPGGSTGGGAASAAARYVPIALGTDGGGSLRRPAAHCGLIGLKTSIGRIPRAGGLPQLLLDFEVAGGLTRSLRDTRTLYAVMAGPEAGVAGPALPPAPPTDGRRLRILSVERFGDAPLDPQISLSFKEFVGRLDSLGHHVVAGPLPVAVDPLAEVWPEIGRIHLAKLFADHPEIARAASPKYQAMAEEGARLPATRLITILDRVATSRSEAARMFEEIDIVVTPSIAALAWPKAESHPTTIDGRPVGPRGHAIYTGWVNAAALPALALPASPAADGNPIGVQLVAALGAEARLLDLGDELAA